MLSVLPASTLPRLGNGQGVHFGEIRFLTGAVDAIPVWLFAACSLQGFPCLMPGRFRWSR